jgi:hypothetical protein
MASVVRRLLLGFLVLATTLSVGSAGAGASPPETETTHEKGTDTFVDVVPSCTEDGALYTITIDFNLVEHATVFEDGRAHFTFTQTGTFVAVPFEDPTLPDASGRFTVWGGFNDNGKAVNGTFTFNVRGQFEDGTRFSIHVTEHFNTTPTGAEFFFAKCHD